MNRKNIAFGVGSTILIIVVGASLALSTVGSTRRMERTVTLRAGSNNFDGVPEPAVLGRLTSISDEDALLRVTMYLKPVATGVEEKECVMGTRRSRSGSLWIEAAITESDLSSGDTVRAVYESLGADGVPVYSSERSWTKP